MVENKSKTRIIIKIATVLFILLGAALVLAELGANVWTQLTGG